MFYGHFEHTIDEKGRTSLPARFRELLSGQSADLLVVTPGYPQKCVWAQPRAAWEEMVRKIDGATTHKQNLRRLFVQQAHDCVLDKTGRVLIPPPLREKAGLKGDVIWAGVGERIELWDAASWAAMQRELESNEDLARTVDEMGL